LEVFGPIGSGRKASFGGKGLLDWGGLRIVKGLRKEGLWALVKFWGGVGKGFTRALLWEFGWV